MVVMGTKNTDLATKLMLIISSRLFCIILMKRRGNPMPLDDIETQKELMNETDRRVYELMEYIFRWTRITAFLVDEGYKAAMNPNTEEQCQRALLDLDTFIICMLLYRRYATLQRDSTTLKPYTLRKLAETISSGSENSLKAQEGKLKRLFEKLEPYKLISIQLTQHTGNRMCYQIEPTDKLVRFFETKLFRGNSL